MSMIILYLIMATLGDKDESRLSNLFKMALQTDPLPAEGPPATPINTGSPGFLRDAGNGGGYVKLTLSISCGSSGYTQLHMDYFPFCKPPSFPILSAAKRLPPNWKGPWANRDLHLEHPVFKSKFRSLKRWFPGFGIGLTGFVIYCCYDYYDSKHGEKAEKLRQEAQFMKERQERLAKQGIHISGHH